jgi:hypothetical protein
MAIFLAGFCGYCLAADPTALTVRWENHGAPPLLASTPESRLFPLRCLAGFVVHFGTGGPNLPVSCDRASQPRTSGKDYRRSE